MHRKIGKLQVIFFFFVLENILSNYCYKAELMCSTGKDEKGFQNCIFENLTTTDTKPLFYPTSDNPTEVSTVEFLNSIMTTLTSELCEAFPNVRDLNLQSLALENIQEGALDQCRSLTQINLGDNALTEIPENLFQYNSKLEQINFGTNKITEIDQYFLFNLAELDVLNISNNYITNLEFQNYPFLDKLKTFDIGNNELIDLDEKEMLWKFPNLNGFYLNGNPFDCKRLRTILENLKQQNVWISPLLLVKRNRSYSPELIDEIECLPTHERIRLFGPLDPLVTKNQLREFKGTFFFLKPVHFDH